MVAASASSTHIKVGWQRPSSHLREWSLSNPRNANTMAANGHSVETYFKTVPKPIAYEGPSSQNPLSYRWYNKDEVIHGKKMSEWLKFSVCYWHTFRGAGLDPFGVQTLFRPWDVFDNINQPYADILVSCKRRADAAFELFTKLGIEYYTFHDRDIAPELATLEETNRLLDDVSDYLLLKQQETGVKLLWGTANLFGAPRYANGGATNPDFAVFAAAAAQVKKAIEITHKLGGSGYVFWGGREGYASLLSTDVKKELDHMAAFFHMAIKHKLKIGATFPFFIEPKPREPSKHQYDYDAQTVMGFIEHYGLNEHFWLNIEPNHTTLAGHQYDHDINVAAAFGKLGSIDCNTGDELLGWDTDQFLMDEKKAALVMQVVLRMGGLAHGGLNFDCKVRRESTDLEDILIAHVGSMDTFAKGLRQAAYILSSGKLPKMLENRYSSWKSTDLAVKVEKGEASFEELEEFVRYAAKPAANTSGKQELFERVFNDELHDAISK
ncbi:xylose isomerase [Zopfochytrium polystomum]|nr:xylose isomerase [Zopfochytrium polystomum]